jgi:hypothetical protein
MKQTAVEWLQEALMTSENAPNYNQWAFNKAKEMQKQQIINAMDWIMNKYFEFHEQPTTSAREQYYNETFKSE